MTMSQQYYKKEGKRSHTKICMFMCVCVYIIYIYEG